MRLDYGERRDFPRMAVDCPMTLRRSASGEEIPGTCLDLSGGGMRFRVSERLPDGTEMEATLTPPSGSVSAPLSVRLVVLRSRSAEEHLEVSARILEILS